MHFNMLLITNHTLVRRLYEEIFVYSLLYTDLWYEFYQYSILFIRRILHLNNLFSFLCGNNMNAMLVWQDARLGSCASFDGIDLVSGKMSSDAEETFMRSSPPVKFISKAVLTESGFFSWRLCKQIVDTLFKYMVKCVLTFACKCVTVAYM